MELIIGFYRSVLMVEFKFVVVFTKRLVASQRGVWKRFISHFLSSLDVTSSVTVIPVQKQKDSSSCGLFAIAFAANILEGISPAESEFNVTFMRKHLLECLEKQQVSAFPQNPRGARRVVSSQGFRIFNTETIEHIINVLSSTYIKACCRNSYFLRFYSCLQY